MTLRRTLLALALAALVGASTIDAASAGYNGLFGFQGGFFLITN